MASRQALTVTVEERNTLRKIIRMVQNIRGSGVTISPDGITISPPQAPERKQPILDRLFPVRVEHVGGSAGDQATQCSFTYDVKLLDDDTVIAEAVALSGNGNRVVDAEMTEGSWGMAFYGDDGEIGLMWVDERITQHNCSA